jgi:hypothetical protein
VWCQASGAVELALDPVLREDSSHLRQTSIILRQSQVKREVHKNRISCLDLTVSATRSDRFAHRSEWPSPHRADFGG